MTNQSDHATADDKTKTMAALGIGAVGVAGCVALVVIGVLVLLGLFALVLLILWRVAFFDQSARRNVLTFFDDFCKLLYTGIVGGPR